MATSLRLTTDEILKAIAPIAGLYRDPSQWDASDLADVREIIRSGLRRFFNPPPVEGLIHQWRFLEKKFNASYVAPYTTGTLAVAAGVATLSGGTFPTWAADGVIRVNGRTLFVTTRTDGNNCVVNNDGLTVTAGTTYTLTRYRYPLPADFAEFIGGVAYIHPTYDRMLRGVMDTEITLRYAANFQTGQTRMYAVLPGSGDDVTPWNVMFWPTFDPDASVMSTYRANPTDNLDASDIRTGSTTVVQIDAVHAETLLAAIQSACEEYYQQAAGIHNARYLTLLAASVAHDRQSQGVVDFSGGNDQPGRAFYLLNHVPTYDVLP